MGTCVAIARASQPTISLPRPLWLASETSVAMHGSYYAIAIGLMQEACSIDYSRIFPCNSHTVLYIQTTSVQLWGLYTCMCYKLDYQPYIVSYTASSLIVEKNEKLDKVNIVVYTIARILQQRPFSYTLKIVMSITR